MGSEDAESSGGDEGAGGRVVKRMAHKPHIGIVQVLRAVKVIVLRVEEVLGIWSVLMKVQMG